ncbi:rod-binding protein [Rhodobacteraceae bacterium]|nr:rod-binding protein [Paracoccaceae bacterium]
MQVARELEASFLTEMLKSAGVGETRKTFGGGAGEDQFSSFLVREYADAMVQAGGIGLAESLYRSLVQTRAVSE